MATIARLCLYCGSSRGRSPVYAAAATRLGTLIAEAGVTLVYGGGHVGLMGLAADAALAAKGRVIGVIPELLRDREVGHTGISERIIVASMHARKQRMFELADGFVVLPGGLGTLDETIEIITWKQLGLHDHRQRLHPRRFARFLSRRELARCRAGGARLTARAGGEAAEQPRVAETSESDHSPSPLAGEGGARCAATGG
jgi:uncharacterized protein (TIGR00730 family)